MVFSDQTLGNFAAADPETCREIRDHFARWDDIDVHVKGRVITSGGHGFSGIARRTLLSILQRRAAALGVALCYQCEVRGLEDLRDADLGLGGRPDLVVAADGANSVVRRQLAAHFEPDLDVRTAKYVWLGTTRLFDAFTFLFVDRPGGVDGVFQAHAYRFDERHSAFIVECDRASWLAAGFDRLDLDGTVAACERLFAPWLDGQPLLANVPPHQRAAPWQSFTRVRNARWHHDRVVLIGDAAHTAHFSIGSGTKLAMEDAIVLARELGKAGAAHAANAANAADAGPCLAPALAAYEAERKLEALRLQNAARNSMEWFENVRRYIGLEPQQFAYSLLTRSQRVSHENLRRRDRAYLGGVERWFAGRAAAAPGASAFPPAAPAAPQALPASPQASPAVPSATPAAYQTSPAAPPPPMFTPFRLRGLTLGNRVVVSPMDMYSAEDGTPNDFHLVHLGARALGGAGLIVTEMTCVSPEGRISPGCTGMYAEAHVAAWRRIVQFVHARSRAAICLQLGHSGGKGSTRLMWEGMDEPLPSGGWEVMAASPVPYRPGMQVPREMTRADMDAVLAQFVRATHMAVAAGFDMLDPGSSRRCSTSAATSTAARSPTACASRSRCSRRCARRGRRRGRCRCASRPPTGSRAACPARRRWQRRRPSTRPARTSCTSRPARPRPRRSRSTGACSRRHGATASATRPACRRSRSATSPSPTRSTRSSPPAAPTSARWRARTSPTRTGPSAPLPSWGLRSNPGRCNI